MWLFWFGVPVGVVVALVIWIREQSARGRVPPASVRRRELRNCWVPAAGPRRSSPSGGSSLPRVAPRSPSATVADVEAIAGQDEGIPIEEAAASLVSAPEPPVWPFVRRRFMVPAEVAMFRVLRTAFPGFHVFAQVGLSCLVDVADGANRTYWSNRVNRMSVDFVLCDARLEVVAVLEVDGPSHSADDAVARDAKKDAVLAAAGIRILRYRNQSLPDVDGIRTAVLRDL